MVDPPGGIAPTGLFMPADSTAKTKLLAAIKEMNLIAVANAVEVISKPSAMAAQLTRAQYNPYGLPPLR